MQKKALQQQELRFKNIVEHANDLIFETDAAGYFTYFNDAVERLSGHERDYLIGRHFLELIREDYRNRAREVFEQQIKTKEPNTYFEYPSVVDDGPGVWFAQNTQIIFEDGHYMGFQAIARDITENIEGIRLHDEALEARRANQIQEENFVAMVSHEIRTPLTAVIGFANLIDPLRLADEDQEHFNGLRSATKRVLRIINDLLDYKKLESGTVAFDDEAIDLRELIERVSRSFFPQIVENQVAIEWQIDDACPERVMGDPGRLEQILQNLIGNSVKFTRSGVIRITVELLAPASAYEIPLKISVIDTGLGFNEDKLRQIFHGYQQVRERVGELEGSGLSLAIFKSLVELQGGNITVQSEPGRGSTFAFSVYFGILDEATTKLTNEARNDVHSEINAPRVLIVDDNDINQYIALQYSKRSYDSSIVVTASDGPTAISAAATQDCDIVLMDIQMPGMDGYEATRQIRSTSSNRKLRIIALTGAVQIASDLRESGFDGVLMKPYTKDQLVNVLEKYLSIRPTDVSLQIRDDSIPEKFKHFKHVDYESLAIASDSDANVMLDIIRMHDETLASYNLELSKLSREGQWSKLSREAHKQKSIARYAGLEAVCEALQIIEGGNRSTFDKNMLGQLVKQICLSRSDALVELKEIRKHMEQQIT